MSHGDVLVIDKPLGHSTDEYCQYSAVLKAVSGGTAGYSAAHVVLERP